VCARKVDSTRAPKHVAFVVGAASALHPRDSTSPLSLMPPELTMNPHLASRQGKPSSNTEYQSVTRAKVSSPLAVSISAKPLTEIGRFMKPDIADLVPQFQKVSGARRMAKHLSKERNQSRSFQVLLEGIERLSKQLQEGNV